MATPLLAAIPASLALVLVTGALGLSGTEREVVISICAAAFVLVGVPYALHAPRVEPVPTEIDPDELLWELHDARDANLRRLISDWGLEPLGAVGDQCTLISWSRRPVRVDDEPLIQGATFKQGPMSVLQRLHNQSAADFAERVEGVQTSAVSGVHRVAVFYDMRPARTPLQLTSGVAT